MTQLWRHQILLVLVASVVFLTNLGSTGLWDLDEALYASCAREMAQRGDWVVPCYNNDVFYDKPPLMFWLMMGSFKVLGTTESAARITSALLAIGSTRVAQRGLEERAEHVAHADGGQTGTDRGQTSTDELGGISVHSKTPCPCGFLEVENKT